MFACLSNGAVIVGTLTFNHGSAIASLSVELPDSTNDDDADFKLMDSTSDNDRDFKSFTIALVEIPLKQDAVNIFHFASNVLQVDFLFSSMTPFERSRFLFTYLDPTSSQFGRTIRFY
jgi:GH15 family glucan-1,4-alpha-glucosidase